jgi:hypothetical protein
MIQMRIAACLFALASLLSGADSPYLKLNQTTRDGVIHLAAENISGKPIVAYVVAIEHNKESGGQATTVHYGVYSGKDQFAAGATVRVADSETRLISGELKVFVDYVRLADGTVWGDPMTEQGKEVAARFKK